MDVILQYFSYIFVALSLIVGIVVLITFFVFFMIFLYKEVKEILSDK